MNFFIKILFFVSFSFGLFNYQDILNKSSLSYSGYSNIYAINRTSDYNLYDNPNVIGLEYFKPLPILSGKIIEFKSCLIKLLSKESSN